MYLIEIPLKKLKHYFFFRRFRDLLSNRAESKMFETNTCLDEYNSMFSLQ